jgi:hypothetical protein
VQAVRKYSNSHLEIVTFNQVIILGGFKSEISIHFFQNFVQPIINQFFSDNAFGTMATAKH